MQTRIIKIGNSQGLRIPTVLLKEHNLAGQVTLTSTPSGLLITADRPRQNWYQAFQNAKETYNQPEEIMDISNDFDDTEWQW